MPDGSTHPSEHSRESSKSQNSTLEVNDPNSSPDTWILVGVVQTQDRDLLSGTATEQDVTDLSSTAKDLSSDLLIMEQ